MRAPIGIRIRRHRMHKDLTQAALARAVGISPSYLNLIENNKREIGGSLLAGIAAQLDIDVDELSGDTEQRTLNALQEVLNDPLFQGLDLRQADRHDLVARFPEVAQALTRLHGAQSHANAELDAYADRLNSDPLLSQMLHEVLSQITALRSSAEILSGMPDLPPDDHSRFTGAITREARGLSQTVRNLASYFDLTSSRRQAISPLREVEDAIIGTGNHYPVLEDLAGDLRTEISDGGEFGETTLAVALQRRFGITCRRMQPGGRRASEHDAGTVAGFDETGKVLWLHASAPRATRQFQMCRLYAQLAAQEVIAQVRDGFALSSEAAQPLAFGALASYVAGATVMPYDAFLTRAEAKRYDIDLLSHDYTASFEQVAHRLVTLRRKGAEGVPFGFLRADPTGRLTKRFPLPGLPLPRSGHGCVLWPIYTVAGAPGIVRQVCEFATGARFLLVAKSVGKRVAAWDEQPLTFSVMVACDLLHADRTVYSHGLDLDDATARVPVGPSCLLCVREDCSHRQEPASAMLRPG